jgi:hypothetical protein
MNEEAEGGQGEACPWQDMVTFEATLMRSAAGRIPAWFFDSPVILEPFAVTVACRIRYS